jgi:branched-chain amino acid transport system substrate-binding protein
MIETTGAAGFARRRFLRMLGAAGAVTACGGLTAACGSAAPGAPGTSGDGATIRIGYLTPSTGALAPFGAADRFVIGAMRQYYAQHPIAVGGRSYPVEIIDRDTQSNVNRAADLATDLIANGGIHLMLVAATPETANPVSDQCEAGGLPCLSTGTPWQPWFFGRAGRPEAPFRWTYNFFWGLGDVEAVYADMWDELSTNKTCAGLWPDDSEGRAWGDPSGGFPPAQARRGYDFVDAGPYPVGSQSFARLIETFRADDPDILVGVPGPADFITFWQQAAQQGFRPKIATIGRALLLPSGVEALGQLGVGLGTEVWWSPRHPFTSSLTGQTAQQLADAYTVATGQQWIQPLGFAHALFEVATRAFSALPAIDDRAGLAAAISQMRIDTVVGPLDWTNGPVPNVATTPLVGGQWRTGTSSPFELVIVSNRRNPNIPTAGTVNPLSTTG